MRITDKLKHWIRHDQTNRHSSILAFLIILAIVGTIFSIIVLFSGFELLTLYRSLLKGAFGDPAKFGNTIIKTTPLLIISIGLIIAFRCGIWNIGAEGQLYLGALGGTLIGLYLNLPTILHILLAMVVGFLTGGAWAGIAAILKTRFNANEIITTLLSNFIAYWFSFYILQFFLRPVDAINPVSSDILSTAQLPIIFPGTVIHAGILVALLLTIIVWFILRRTSLGYFIDAIGSSKLAAAYGGIRVNRIILISMFLSGGLAGIAGVIEISGIHHHLLPDLSPNYGFIAIAIAIIARFNPFGAIIASLFFGAILTGGRYLQATMGVPAAMINILVGLFIISILLQPILEKIVSRNISKYAEEER